MTAGSVTAIVGVLVGLAVLGVVGIHDVQLFNKREGEIGYWVRTKYVGQGFVTEAVNGITASDR